MPPPVSPSPRLPVSPSPRLPLSRAAAFLPFLSPPYSVPEHLSVPVPFLPFPFFFFFFFFFFSPFWGLAGLVLRWLEAGDLPAGLVSILRRNVLSAPRT